MKRSLSIVFFLFVASIAGAQDSSHAIRIAPGPEYKAGFLHRIIYGSNWRDLWTTPITVPVLDLSTYAGGLTPTKKGGGLQTKSIRFRGGDGKEYKFRSMDKDPSKVLAPELRKSLIADIAKDLISTVNPVGALVTSPVLDAADVLNSHYSLFVLPKDDRLGEFKEEFGGILGMLEENPASGEDGNGFAGADKIKTTLKLYAKLEEDNDNYVDAVAYLKARMLDIYFGDWDRHYDQWLWAGYQEGKRMRWEPIPRDRDQAYCLFHGIVPYVFAVNVPQVESADDKYPALVDLTWSGRQLDRKFLSSVEKPVWDSLKTFLLSVLTDSLIEYSARQMPPEMFEKRGEELIKTMRSRRNKFADAIDEYYDLLARYVDIWGSDKSEYATVNRVNEDTVIVDLFKRDKDAGGAKGEPFFHRAFDRHDTKELRIYLQDGDDFAKVEGKTSGSILTRIIGGEGKDELVDSSNVKGYALGILPFSINRVKTIFYDNGDKNDFVYGSSTRIDNSKFVLPPDDSLSYEPKYRNWGHEWFWAPWVNYGSDDGVFVGVVDILKNYSFRSIPFQNRMMFQGGYAIKAQRFIAEYQAQFPDVWKGTLWINAHVSGLGALNFFGIGNETKYLSANYDKNFYKIKQRLYTFAPSYEYQLFPHFTLRGTAALRYIQTPLTELPDSSLLLLAKPYGIGDHLLTTYTASGTYDSRNSTFFPEKGVLLNATSVWTPEIIGNKYSYTKAIGDARLYLTANIFGGVTLALRAHGEKIWGKHPFFDACYLGGLNDLRGYYRERFAGDASAFGAAELRVNLGKFHILVPGDFGFTVGAESGKVFVDKQDSKLLHTSVVWGVWIAPVMKDYVLSLSVASSEERTAIYVQGRFSF